jgi:phage terminase large subunit GpA-like protein
MDNELRKELIDVFKEGIQLPYSDGIKKWCETNLVLPPAYAIPGKLDLSISPYLHDLLKDIDDPTVEIIIFAKATQIGGTLFSEIAIPYWVVNSPGPIMRLFHNNDISKTFVKQRLIPLLQNCEQTAPLLKYDRHSATNTEINFPHMSIIMKGANDGIAHGLTIKRLIADEVHQWEEGMLSKAIARTTAFAGRRKILIISQPDKGGSEFERYFKMGMIHEWQYKCPACGEYSAYNWSTPRNDADETYYGFNWDTILMPDGETTDIALSSKTCWLECKCGHKIEDTPSNRYLLNTTAKYKCTKPDGDPKIKAYTCPNFVNVNLSFQSAAAQYLVAKKILRTGVNTEMQTFVNQVLGQFYNPEVDLNISSVLREEYEKENLDKDWLLTMGIDVQKEIKYYVIRAWHRNGNESRLIEFGICRTWNELGIIQKKWKIVTPMVGVDTGFATDDCYQESLMAGGNYIIKAAGKQVTGIIGWTPFKGEGTKSRFMHPDKIERLYSVPFRQDSNFPKGHKFHGVPVNLILFASSQIQVILGNLRDNKTPGVKWLIDTSDNDYLSQIYAEGFADTLNKKTGLTETKWVEKSNHNHMFDCEKLCLVNAIRAGFFTLASS